MDIAPQDNTQPISDDQELAKALAGVLPEDDSTTDSQSPTGLQFEETAAPAGPPTPALTVAPVVPIAPLVVPEPPAPAPVLDIPVPALDIPAPAEDLDGIKLNALKELRPLMDKVDLPAEEKFDTYLMLIRSTDDKTLIAPAHTAAQSIADEKRKAEALLEIIKEIDYLSRKEPAA